MAGKRGFPFIQDRRYFHTVGRAFCPFHEACDQQFHSEAPDVLLGRQDSCDGWMAKCGQFVIVGDDG